MLNIIQLPPLTKKRRRQPSTKNTSCTVTVLLCLLTLSFRFVEGNNNNNNNNNNNINNGLLLSRPSNHPPRGGEIIANAGKTITAFLAATSKNHNIARDNNTKDQTSSHISSNHDNCNNNNNNKLGSCNDNDSNRNSKNNNDDDHNDVDEEFLIQGFRWHTMSVKHEAERLNKLALKLRFAASAATTTSCSPNDSIACSNNKRGSTKKMATEDNKALSIDIMKSAIDYVISFNMKGLQRIEKQLFFPFVRQKVKQNIKDKYVINAFNTIMDDLEYDQKRLSELGANLEKITSSSLKKEGDDERQQYDQHGQQSSSGNRNTHEENVIDSVIENSELVIEHINSMLYLENNFIIPTIAKFVPKHEQISFNNKVIRNLGMLDSRLYLVGMYEAINTDENEKELFVKQIPSIPRYMIPRWKKSLYDTKAGMLNI